MHVSVQCATSKDSRKEWDIGKGEFDEMATKAEIKEAVRDVVRDEVQKAVQQLAVGQQPGWNKDHMNLKAVEERLKK